MALLAIKKVQVITLKSLKKTGLSHLKKYAACEFIGDKTKEFKNDSYINDLREVEKEVLKLDFVINKLSTHYKDTIGLEYIFFGKKG